MRCTSLALVLWHVRPRGMRWPVFRAVKCHRLAPCCTPRLPFHASRSCYARPLTSRPATHARAVQHASKSRFKDRHPLPHCNTRWQPLARPHTSRFLLVYCPSTAEQDSCTTRHHVEDTGFGHESDDGVAGRAHGVLHSVRHVTWHGYCTGPHGTPAESDSSKNGGCRRPHAGHFVKVSIRPLRQSEHHAGHSPGRVEARVA